MAPIRPDSTRNIRKARFRRKQAQAGGRRIEADLTAEEAAALAVLRADGSTVRDAVGGAIVRAAQDRQCGKLAKPDRKRSISED